MIKFIKHFEILLQTMGVDYLINISLNTEPLQHGISELLFMLI